MSLSACIDTLILVPDRADEGSRPLCEDAQGRSASRRRERSARDGGLRCLAVAMAGAGRRAVGSRGLAGWAVNGNRDASRATANVVISCGGLPA